MNIVFRFRVDGHYLLKDYYTVEFAVSHRPTLRDVYLCYIRWLSDNQRRMKGVSTALIDYISFGGVVFLDGDILRLNPQTFKKVAPPTVESVGLELGFERVLKN